MKAEQTVFDSTSQFPPPKRDGDTVYLKDGKSGWLVRYVAKSGSWIASGRIYPAREQ
jgi:hypothetical protein